MVGPANTHEYWDEPKRLIPRERNAPPSSLREFVFATVMYASGDWESTALMPTNLVDSIARYTALAVAPKPVFVDLGSPEIFRYPFVWLTGHLAVRFTDTERRNLRTYVDHGGFMVIDDHNHDIDGIFHKTAMEEIVRTFGPRALAPVPNEHELYSIFFKFEDGAPDTVHELNGWGDNLIHRHLFAVQRNGRIGLLYSSKDYSSEWNFHPEMKKQIMSDPTKFGVNLVVYALTR